MSTLPRALSQKQPAIGEPEVPPPLVESSEQPSRSAACERELQEQFVLQKDGTVRPRYPNKGDEIFKLVRDFKPDYAGLKSPSLCIYGLKKPTIPDGVRDEDRAKWNEFLGKIDDFRRKQLDTVKKAGAHVRVVELKEAGHYCHIDQQEEVLKEMKAFLIGKRP